MNPSQSPRKAPLKNSSLPVRILMVLGGLFLLMIIVAMFMRLLGSSGSLNKSTMLPVAQDQTEIMRLADSGVESSVGQTNKNFAITVKLATSSQRADFLAYLKTNNFAPKDKDLGLRHNASADSQLESAKSSSTFDIAYKSVMQTTLANYQKDLNAAYSSADTAGKTVLKKDFDAAQLLLTQLGQI